MPVPRESAGDVPGKLPFVFDDKDAHAGRRSACDTKKIRPDETVKRREAQLD